MRPVSLPCVLLLALLRSIETDAQALTFTWMAPSNTVSHLDNLNAASSLGALALAVDEVVNDASILPGVTINVKYEDSKCDAKVTLSKVYEAYLGSSAYTPDAIIGPPCTDAMDFVAQLMTYKDWPVVGWASDSASFRSESRGTYLNYESLIRVFPPINAIGQGMISFLTDLDWMTVFIISTSGSRYESLGSGVEAAVTGDAAFSLAHHKTGVEDDADDDTIREIYKQLKSEARIVILCTPRSTLRQWMLAAREQGMTKGEYGFVFANQELPTDTLYNELTSADIYKGSDGKDEDAKQAFQSLLILTVQTENTTRTSTFYTNAAAAAVATAPTNWQTDFGIPASAADGYAPYLHDAVRLYLILADEARADASLDEKKGTDMKSLATNRRFTGPEWVTGDVILDSHGDRDPSFWLLSLGSDGVYEIAKDTTHELNATGVFLSVNKMEDIIWGNGKTGDENKPVANPSCGFKNENCPNLALYIGLPVAILVVIVIIVIIVLLYRRYQFEQSLKDMLWKINRPDMKMSSDKEPGSALLKLSRASIRRSHQSGLSPGLGAAVRKSVTHLSKADTASVTSEERQMFINTASYKGATVAWRDVRKDKLKLDRELMVEMKLMTDINHTNLATFVGATTETNDLMEVWEYCPKGSLQDVIWNENIKLDDMFKFSIAMDICKALKYLHDSPLKMHGKMKSSNCIIDARWMCKITDYALFRFREGQGDDPELTAHKIFSREFWTAPELLRKMTLNNARWADDVSHAVKPAAPPVSRKFSEATGRKVSDSGGRKTSETRVTETRPASLEGDVYAVGVILKEIFARNGPYTEHDDYDPNEIIEKVKVGPMTLTTGATTIFRPSLSEVKDKAPLQLMDVMRAAWAEKPSDRPSIPHLLKDIQRINPFKSANVMDNMIKMMERYSNNLEEMVDEKTSQVEEEKKKSEMLLYKMLPPSVGESLRVGKSVPAELYDNVSLYFSDIVKFTNLSSSSTPIQVVQLLNDLYTLFDNTIADHDVYKVETIGDAYMLASGVPDRNGDSHVVEITNCALDLLAGVMNFKVAHKPDYILRIRIGLHTGPSVAGVVGVTMPRYCLFGNTVTVCQNMESGGAPMRVHISPSTYRLLCKFEGYYTCAREANIDIPGEGKCTTYFVYGRDGYPRPLPDFDELSTDETVPLKKLPVTKGRSQRTGLPDRPSVESGIFELDTGEESGNSRKPSAATPDTPRLAEIREASAESVRQTGPASPGSPPGEADPSPGPAPALAPHEEARPTTAGPGALHQGVWSEEAAETQTGPRRRKKSVLEGGVLMQELDDVDVMDDVDEEGAGQSPNDAGKKDSSDA